MTHKDLYWQNDKTPASKRYEDIYFSAEDGLLESRHVFLKGINAPKIWQNKDYFCLLENGFGTGLNFTATCQEWLNTCGPDAHLTYIATEKHPLSASDVDKALSTWPDLKDFAQELTNNYPPQVPGFHQRTLFDGRVTLLLLFGDCTDSLPNLDAACDAIYLDGFAPSKNPEMWSNTLFTQIARLSKTHAKLATFTAAGFVRRGLESVGFQMQKTKGFGKKRESLTGEFTEKSITDIKPWFHRPPALANDKEIAVIGAGIAGLTLALSLKKMGYKTTLYDREQQAMMRASGNPAGILDPVLNYPNTTEGAFYYAALFQALNFYQKLGPEVFLHKGLTKHPVSGAERKRFDHLLSKNFFPNDFITNDVDRNLHIKDCGAISPPKIRDILSEKLTLKTASNITHISRDNKWHLYDGDHIIGSADAVVFCGGASLSDFPEITSIPIEQVRGQISLLETQSASTPPHVFCGKGYIIPPMTLNDKECVVTGASFNRHKTSRNINTADHLENINTAATLWPDIKNHKIIGGRADLRAYTPDHLPLCGPVPDFNQYKAAYHNLKHGPKHQNFATAPYHKNLYIISGLGARGFLTAPILADLLTAVISGHPLPLPRNNYEALHPARFTVRKLIKGK